MSKERRRTYFRNDGGNNIGISADFIIHISKTESDPSKMITVDGDPEPLLKGFRRCVMRAAGGKARIAFLKDDNSNYFEDGTPVNLTGLDGDVMVYFPEFWYKGTDTDSEWVFNITTTQVNKENYEEQGWHHAPASLVGAYKGYVARGQLYSRSGVERTTNISMSVSSAYSRNRGKGFHIIDYQQHCIIAWMFYARYKNTNSQAICGTGYGYGSISTGSTNTLGITDTTSSIARPTNSNILVNFLGIEGCWGSFGEFIEGIHSYSRDGIIAYDKGDFHDQPYSSVASSTKRILRTPSEGNKSGFISEIKGGEYMDVFGSEFNGGAGGTTYFCDTSSVGPGGTYIFMRSNEFDSQDGGILYLYGVDTADTISEYYSSRLAFDGEITVIDSPTTFKAISNFR